MLISLCLSKLMGMEPTFLLGKIPCKDTAFICKQQIKYVKIDILCSFFYLLSY